MRRWFLLLAIMAGLFGASGVAAAAAAAHLGAGQLLDTAATFLMINAAALLAIAALGSRSLQHGATGFAIAGSLIVLGTLLFCGDFAVRSLAGRALFPMAAPSGGILLILGWLATAVAAAVAALRGPKGQRDEA